MLFRSFLRIKRHVIEAMAKKAADENRVFMEPEVDGTPKFFAEVFRHGLHGDSDMTVQQYFGDSWPSVSENFWAMMRAVRSRKLRRAAGPANFTSVPTMRSDASPP